MKIPKIVLAVMILISAALFALGIVFMVVCDFVVAGLIVMWVGLAVCIPICPIYQKIGGYEVAFKSKRNTVSYLCGVLFIIALGVGITLVGCPINTTGIAIKVSGVLLAGFAFASLIINAFVSDALKKMG